MDQVADIINNEFATADQHIINTQASGDHAIGRHVVVIFVGTDDTVQTIGRQIGVRSSIRNVQTSASLKAKVFVYVCVY